MFVDAYAQLNDVVNQDDWPQLTHYLKAIYVKGLRTYVLKPIQSDNVNLSRYRIACSK